MCEQIELSQWRFAIGPQADCLSLSQPVTVPHTWNVDPAYEAYNGIGWYAYRLKPQNSWKGKRLTLVFRGVYHDAAVFVNGQLAGRHEGSGYTPFSVEITDLICYDDENNIIVRVDNQFSDQMLPYRKSFDWSNDGGIIRPVFLEVTGGARISSVFVSAEPVLTAQGNRQDTGYALFSADVSLSYSDTAALPVLYWRLLASSGRSVVRGELAVTDNTVRIPKQLLQDIRYWHFDRPDLYTLQIELFQGSEISHTYQCSIGFRSLRQQDGKWIFNGEPVRLPGMEWMPGSNPEVGAAESRQQLEHMLQRLKDANCIVTRFHWQQDAWIYDWCDRHGLLVQEEVPFWGGNPEKIGASLFEISARQLTEMIQAHQTHPSIIAWGVGNELNGQDPSVQQYIRDAVALVHRLDPTRMANYVSNSLWQDPSRDGTLLGDALMINDYIGTWHVGMDPVSSWKAAVDCNPGRTLIPAEFGLCEPVFEGGDATREAIFRSKLEQYRKIPSIPAVIYFCLNDYRTQMGEDGTGRFCRRVHGSTDWLGNPKPSYTCVQAEYAPLSLRCQNDRLEIRCKDSIPCYTVKNYKLCVNGTWIDLPELTPGQSLTLDIPGLRPGDAVSISRQAAT